MAEDVKERCVICGRETSFDRATPVEARGESYVSGLGQLCFRCLRSVDDPRCSICDRPVRNVDSEYLYGNDHIACVLGGGAFGR